MASRPIKPFSSKDAVVCRGVGKTWAAGTPRAHEALRDVELDVAPGEFIALLGPSGCGKSTLLYLVAGLEAASDGGIWSFGDPVETPSPERSLIFQETSLFPWLSVWQNVSFGLSLRGESRGRTQGGGAACAGARRSVRGDGQAAGRIVGRHAPARRGGARAGDAAEGVADGRAVRRAGCADAGEDAGLPAGCVARVGRVGAVRHASYRGGDRAGRPRRGVHVAARVG